MPLFGQYAVLLTTCVDATCRANGNPAPGAEPSIESGGNPRDSGTTLGKVAVEVPSPIDPQSSPFY